MSDTNKRIEELLKNLNFDPEIMNKVKALLPAQPSKSRIIVREAMWEIISFVHENRATILPFATKTYELIDQKKTESEMLTAYIMYMFEDFIEGSRIMVQMAETLGFDEMVERARDEKVKRDADVEANGIEMI